jgi:nitrogen fixation NifU-like protein
MSELDSLYQELILEHYKHPRNKEPLEGRFITHENPSCGDTLRLKIEWDGSDRIHRVVFDGHGCAISTASASIITELLAGKTRGEALELCHRAIAFLRGDSGETTVLPVRAAGLGVRARPQTSSSGSIGEPANPAHRPRAGSPHSNGPFVGSSQPPTLQADSQRPQTEYTPPSSSGDLSDLGDLKALEGVRLFPLRVKCATLPWHGIEKELEEK